APPLFRVRPEAVVGRLVPEQFAGSILDLRPATSYDIELHATDADGPVDQTIALTATTRAVPGDPASPSPVGASDPARLDARRAWRRDPARRRRLRWTVRARRERHRGESDRAARYVDRRHRSRRRRLRQLQRARGLRQRRARRAADAPPRQSRPALPDGGRR